MTNSELIAKLKNLKNINPDESFIKSNRDLLLAQVSNSGAEKIGAWKSIFISFENLAKVSARPAFALGAFVITLLGAGIFSHKMLENSKPNDSLYIARVISERLKVNTTFDANEREKLASRYAIERAEDIAAVLGDDSFNKEENQDQVAKLSDDFKVEVEKAKTSLSRLPLENKVVAAVAPVVNESDPVVIAENEKDISGIEVYAPEGGIEEAEAVSTTTESVSPALRIDEINTLIDQKDYVKAQEKLNEIKEIMK